MLGDCMSYTIIYLDSTGQNTTFNKAKKPLNNAENTSKILVLLEALDSVLLRSDH